METDLYKKAYEYVLDDDFDKAIPLFINDLDNGNYDSAYELGLIYEELIDEPNLDIAIKYFEFGKSHNHKECSLELANIYLNNDKYRNLKKYFTCVNSDFLIKNKIDLINFRKAVDKIGEFASGNKDETLLHEISYLKNIKHHCSKKATIECINDRIKKLQFRLMSKIINGFTCMDDLKIAKVLYEGTYEKDIYDTLKFKFLQKYLDISLASLHSPEDAIALIELNKQNSLSTSEVYIWLGKFYESSPYFNYKLAYKYFQLSNNENATNEMLLRLSHKFYDENNSYAFYSIKKHISNGHLYDYEELAKKFEDKLFYEEQLRNYNAKTKYSAFHLARCYQLGCGVEMNYDKALLLYKEEINTTKYPNAFHNVYDILSSQDIDNDEIIFKLLRYCDEEEILLNKDEFYKYSYGLQLRNLTLIHKSLLNHIERLEMFDYKPRLRFQNVSQEWKEKLRCELKRRNITKLIHFTAGSNVKSILENGILSRIELGKRGYIDDFAVTDNNRVEGNLNSISLSITSPNKWMMEKKIEEGVLNDPCIVEIDPELLCDNNVRSLFCDRNAASSEANIGPLFIDFLKMFSPASNYIDSKGNKVFFNRDEKNLSTNQTTNGQAEILIEEKIPRKYIKLIRRLNGNVLYPENFYDTLPF